MLPETMKCPHCGEELELDTIERTTEIVKCPTCGKDVHSSSSPPADAEVFETRYPTLRGYSSIVKLAGFMIGVVYFLLFVTVAVEVAKYTTWLLIAGGVLAISIVVPYLVLSETIKAHADIADNSHDVVTLLRELVRKRQE